MPLQTLLPTQYVVGLQHAACGWSTRNALAGCPWWQDAPLEGGWGRTPVVHGLQHNNTRPTRLLHTVSIRTFYRRYMR